MNKKTRQDRRGRISRARVIPGYTPILKLGAVLVMALVLWSFAHAQYPKIRPDSYRHIMQADEARERVPAGTKLPRWGNERSKLKPCAEDPSAFGLGCPGPIITQPLPTPRIDEAGMMQRWKAKMVPR